MLHLGSLLVSRPYGSHATEFHAAMRSRITASDCKGELVVVGFETGALIFYTMVGRHVEMVRHVAPPSHEVALQCPVTCLCFSACGRYLAMGTETGSVLVFDLEMAKGRMAMLRIVYSHDEHLGRVQSLCWSPNATRVVSGDSRGCVMDLRLRPHMPYDCGNDLAALAMTFLGKKPTSVVYELQESVQSMACSSVDEGVDLLLVSGASGGVHLFHLPVAAAGAQQGPHVPQAPQQALWRDITPSSSVVRGCLGAVPLNSAWRGLGAAGGGGGRVVANALVVSCPVVLDECAVPPDWSKWTVVNAMMLRICMVDGENSQTHLLREVFSAEERGGMTDHTDATKAATPQNILRSGTSGVSRVFRFLLDVGLHHWRYKNVLLAITADDSLAIVNLEAMTYQVMDIFRCAVHSVHMSSHGRVVVQHAAPAPASASLQFDGRTTSLDLLNIVGHPSSVVSPRPEAGMPLFSSSLFWAISEVQRRWRRSMAWRGSGVHGARNASREAIAFNALGGQVDTIPLAGIIHRSFDSIVSSNSVSVRGVTIPSIRRTGSNRHLPNDVPPSLNRYSETSGDSGRGGGSGRDGRSYAPGLCHIDRAAHARWINLRLKATATAVEKRRMDALERALSRSVAESDAELEKIAFREQREASVECRNAIDDGYGAEETSGRGVELFRALEVLDVDLFDVPVVCSAASSSVAMEACDEVLRLTRLLLGDIPPPPSPSSSSSSPAVSDCDSVSPTQDREEEEVHRLLVAAMELVVNTQVQLNHLHSAPDGGMCMEEVRECMDSGTGDGAAQREEREGDEEDAFTWRDTGDTHPHVPRYTAVQSASGAQTETALSVGSGVVSFGGFMAKGFEKVTSFSQMLLESRPEETGAKIQSSFQDLLGDPEQTGVKIQSGLESLLERFGGDVGARHDARTTHEQIRAIEEHKEQDEDVNSDHDMLATDGHDVLAVTHEPADTPAVVPPPSPLTTTTTATATAAASATDPNPNPNPAYAAAAAAAAFAPFAPPPRAVPSIAERIHARRRARLGTGTDTGAGAGPDAVSRPGAARLLQLWPGRGRAVPGQEHAPEPLLTGMDMSPVGDLVAQIRAHGTYLVELAVECGLGLGLALRKADGALVVTHMNPVTMHLCGTGGTGPDGGASARSVSIPGPAQRSGLVSVGDVLLEIDEVDLVEIGYDATVRLLKSLPTQRDSVVTLRFARWSPHASEQSEDEGMVGVTEGLRMATAVMASTAATAANQLTNAAGGIDIIRNTLQHSDFRGVVVAGDDVDYDDGGKGRGILEGDTSDADEGSAEEEEKQGGGEEDAVDKSMWRETSGEMSGIMHELQGAELDSYSSHADSDLADVLDSFPPFSHHSREEGVSYSEAARRVRIRGRHCYPSHTRVSVVPLADGLAVSEESRHALFSEEKAYWARLQCLADRSAYLDGPAGAERSPLLSVVGVPKSRRSQQQLSGEEDWSALPLLDGPTTAVTATGPSGVAHDVELANASADEEAAPEEPWIKAAHPTKQHKQPTVTMRGVDASSVHLVSPGLARYLPRCPDGSTVIMPVGDGDEYDEFDHDHDAPAISDEDEDGDGDGDGSAFRWVADSGRFPAGAQGDAVFRPSRAVKVASFVLDVDDELSSATVALEVLCSEVCERGRGEHPASNGGGGGAMVAQAAVTLAAKVHAALCVRAGICVGTEPVVSVQRVLGALCTCLSIMHTNTATLPTWASSAVLVRRHSAMLDLAIYGLLDKVCVGRCWFAVAPAPGAHGGDLLVVGAPDPTAAAAAAAAAAAEPQWGDADVSGSVRVLAWLASSAAETAAAATASASPAKKSTLGALRSILDEGRSEETRALELAPAPAPNEGSAVSTRLLDEHHRHVDSLLQALDSALAARASHFPTAFALVEKLRSDRRGYRGTYEK